MKLGSASKESDVCTIHKRCCQCQNNIVNYNKHTNQFVQQKIGESVDERRKNNNKREHTNTSTDDNNVMTNGNK